METLSVEAPFNFLCYQCGGTAAIDASFKCPGCGQPMSLHANTVPPFSLMSAPPKNMWHYAPLLPVSHENSIVSLGEGATPLVHAVRLGVAHDFAELTFKNECANPTGSFKDRQISVGISHAIERGANAVAVVSSGNVACSTAAYAARAGARAYLFMHGHASPDKIAQAAIYGAQVFCVDTPRPSEVFDLCIAACEKHGWHHLSTAGMYEPYNVEGAKTIAYELYQQHEGKLPDWIVAPVGGGGLLGGIWRGLRDLKRLGLIEFMPRLAGVQAAGCAPLQQALENNWSFEESLKHPWSEPNTIAGGIADDILFDGHTALPAIRETNGTAISVTDDEILASLSRLARSEGLLIEPTCAVVIAALRHLPEVDAGTRVCCILTGTGLKAMSTIKECVPKPHTIAPSIEALETLLPPR